MKTKEIPDLTVDRPGTLLYLCRFCGKTVMRESKTANRPLSSLLNRTSPELHLCQEDTLGVMDLIGATFDVLKNK